MLRGEEVNHIVHVFLYSINYFTLIASRLGLTSSEFIQAKVATIKIGTQNLVVTVIANVLAL